MTGLMIALTFVLADEAPDKKAAAAEKLYEASTKQLLDAKTFQLPE